MSGDFESEDQFPDLAQDDLESQPERVSWLAQAWEYTLSVGLAETVLRLGTHALLMALILLFAWGLRQFYLLAQVSDVPDEAAFAAPLPTITPTVWPVDLPAIQNTGDFSGIPRQARLHTDVPSRPRERVLTYTVKQGDTLFGIADKFGLKPETLLWANQYVLGDNPHNLRPDQELNILPMDGAYHRWSAGDGLNGVAKFFGVAPEDIINCPGNNLSPETIGDWSNPNIQPGAWIIIPGGRREFVSWSAPDIPRDNPAVAAVLGPGACDSVMSGAIGSGAFIWPADNHFLSGYDYAPEANHPGIDIDGDEGQPVYAADSGVIVYAGWNNWGYGNVVVINHGNGWQTLYAHLSAYYVSCGQSVWQGNVIAAIGNTGNSDGSHLHFEMMYNGVRVNPHEYIR
ncbi:MAG: peptidoglycan DD-metalloendopeptidase family protein [Anaerolineales bacterium]|nr:peptidoglycan DD-metalloendopeptidase family protein [Anaerolineales bacterium]